MSISAFTHSYFNGFKELDVLEDKNFQEKAVVYLKVASYFTVIIPLAIGIVYGCSLLYGRIKREYDKKQAERVSVAAARSLSDVPRSLPHVESAPSSAPQTPRPQTPPPALIPPRHEPIPHFVDFNNELNRLFENADNNGEDAFALAEAYREGNLGLDQDQNAAQRWYLRAANLGHEEAIHLLQALQESVNRQPQPVFINHYATTELLQQHAQGNDPEAMYELARRYQEDPNVSESDIVVLYQNAAHLDHPKAKLELAKIYQHQNRFLDACELFFDLANHDDSYFSGTVRSALLTIKSGHPQVWNDFVNQVNANVPNESLYRTGLRAELGIGVEVNEAIAHELYSQAAQQGHSDAKTRAGEFYFRSYQNESLTHDERVENLRRAIESLEAVSSAEASYLLGLIYCSPEKGIINLDKAINLLENAVIVGYQPAIQPYVKLCTVLGNRCQNSGNLEGARYYFEKAARLGSA